MIGPRFWRLTAAVVPAGTSRSVILVIGANAVIVATASSRAMA